MSIGNAKDSVKKIMKMFEPPPRLTASQWADEHRRLASSSSAESGQWKTSRTPYLKKVMDCLYTEDIQDVTCVFAAQTGKSEYILNDIGRRMHLSPAPMLVIMPTLEMAEAWSEDRLSLMIAETPVLKNLVSDAKSRDKRNTKRHKKFTGGVLTIAGANSAASLSMRAIRDLRCDEVDRFPISAKNATGKSEGDPIALAEARTSTYHDYTIIKVSTPTDDETSRILASFRETDQRKYFVPCPHCGHLQILLWDNVHWQENNYESVHYVCTSCKGKIQEGHKTEMLERGLWRKTAETDTNKAGFWLNGLYSPWVRWQKLAKEYDEAKRSRKAELMKVFINTRLAEGYKENLESFDSHNLFMRREHYDNIVPDGVLVITAGVDTQDDRLEVQVIGWGHDDENWAIEYEIIWGDPASKDIWEKLDAFLAKKYTLKNNEYIGISSTCIDSRGHYNSKVWEFCATRKFRFIYAIHGIAGENRAIVGQPKRPKSGRMRRHCLVFPVGTYEAKNIIYSQLKLVTEGASYCHFPIRDCFNDDFFKQLTSEQKRVVYKHGYPTKEWILPEGRRNEALDTRVYAMAALYIIKPNFELIESRRTNYKNSLEKEIETHAKRVEGATIKDEVRPINEAKRQKFFKRRGRNNYL